MHRLNKLLQKLYTCIHKLATAYSVPSSSSLLNLLPSCTNNTKLCYFKLVFHTCIWHKVGLFEVNDIVVKAALSRYRDFLDDSLMHVNIPYSARSMHWSVHVHAIRMTLGYSEERTMCAFRGKGNVCLCDTSKRMKNTPATSVQKYACGGGGRVSIS